MFCYIRQNITSIFRLYKAINKYRTTKITKNPKIPQRQLYPLIYSFVSLTNIIDFLNPFEHNITDKSNRYWVTKTMNQLLEEADLLYTNEKYLDIYELLNRIQFHKNVEVQWRICRALFKMSQNPDVSKHIATKMILEAYELIQQTLEQDSTHAEVYKWMAILLDAKSGLDGTVARVKAAYEVKNHLLKSLELRPNDPSILYMLGKHKGFWSYEMTKLSWFQRKLANWFYYPPPHSSYEEAYEYFLSAEQVKPRFFIGNVYMLGRTSFEMGMYYRARYYLTIASELPVHSEIERTHSDNAKKLAEKLVEYDVTMQSLGL